MAVNSGFSFDLTPDKAIEFLESKRAFSKYLDEPTLKDSARARATRIANLSSLEMTTNIYQSMIEAKQNKVAYSAWVKEVMNTFERKGWIAGIDSERKAPIIADPQTGEVFGSPRRLETIYRTNMQAAFAAQEYQQLMDNIDSRPYWQYSAILDDRTRPRHAAMHGLVFRYDDPFWTTFYPPNGFNCRCSVNALKERDIARQHLQISEGENLLTEVEVEFKKGEKTKMVGIKTVDGSVMTTDKGFNENVGRRVYKPNLDLYPEKLAHEFAKVEMKGFEFQHTYQKLENAFNVAFKEKIQKHGLKSKKLSEKLSQEIQEALRLEHKFAAGIIRESDAKLLNIEYRSVWLSDSSLLKQFNSRMGDKNFIFEHYQQLPNVIHNADHVLFDGKNITFFQKIDDERGIMAVVKVLEKTKENFLLSLRLGKISEILGKKEVMVIR